MDGIAHCGRVEETTLHFIEVIQRLIALATDVALRSCVARAAPRRAARDTERRSWALGELFVTLGRAIRRRDIFC